jgi:mono/diheme cytochrome c family protein
LKTLIRHYHICSLAIAFVWSSEFPSMGQATRSSSLEAYRKYATTREGDVTRGAKLFADEQKLACAKCHSADGSASKAGPDLLAVGDKFGRRDLVDAVLMPNPPGLAAVDAAAGVGPEMIDPRRRAFHQDLRGRLQHLTVPKRQRQGLRTGHDRRSR